MHYKIKKKVETSFKINWKYSKFGKISHESLFLFWTDIHVVIWQKNAIWYECQITSVRVRINWTVALSQRSFESRINQIFLGHWKLTWNFGGFPWHRTCSGFFLYGLQMFDFSQISNSGYFWDRRFRTSFVSVNFAFKFNFSWFSGFSSFG